ncbi:MAG: nodulation protein NfeD [Chloroflexota bacterium]|nr:nodulation protein NfeD [Chloroflexota bacterium]
MGKLRWLLHATISALFVVALLNTYIAYASSKNDIITVEIKGAIQPSTADYIRRVIAEAELTQSTALLIELDTPGGMLESTREIVTLFLESKIPIVTYVTPDGARAGSAGTFIMAASHIAAMAPTTNIGAASPVSADGSDLNATLKSKATQDAAALMRSIADTRDRNSAALEATIFESKAYSSDEALEQNIVDIIAKDREQLLTLINGMIVTTQIGMVTINTESVNLQKMKRNWKEKFLDAVGDPNITFILLTIGSIGLTIEFVSPGILVGGFVGLLATALAFVGMGQLPVNWFAMVLIIAAVVLFILETQGAGLGFFAIGGTICFALGGFLLYGDFGSNPIEGNLFTLSMWLLGLVVVVLSALLLFLVLALRDTMSRGSPSNYASIIGSEGIVRVALDPTGSVLVGSEVWTATSEHPTEIGKGKVVVINSYDGVQLLVSEKKEEV